MRKGKISNIQKKYLTYTLLLLALTIILSSVGVWIFMRKNMTEVIVDNYVFINEKMGMTLDYLYTRSDETTAECILDDAVQDSLKSRELEEMEKNALSKYFAYLDLEDIEEYCYVDNKKNVYTKSYSKISYEDFQESDLEDALAGTYAETKWFLTRDTLFGTGEEALCQLCRQLLLLLFQKLRKRKAFAQIAADGRRERRRETGALQTCGQLCQDLVQRRTKSQTKHLICLIQHEHGQAFQVDGAFMDVLQQPSRGRNQDMSALFHVFPLKGERLFADQHLMMGVQKEA